MSSLNKACLIGNLGADPEIRRTQSGDPIANLRLATSEHWRDKHTGERRERTEWHRVTLFGQLADIADRYLRKGSKVYIEGKIQTRKWQDQSGEDRYTTEIVCSGFDSRLVMLSSRDEDRLSSRQEDGWGQDDHERGFDAQRPASGGSDYPSGGGGAPAGDWSQELDDNVPFAPEWR